MKILAIESSGLPIQVALVEFPPPTPPEASSGIAVNSGSRTPNPWRLRAQATTPNQPGPGASAQLAPLIQQVLQEAQVPAGELAGVAVSCGPGSFTGLRVGMLTAKVWCYARQIPIWGVPTHAAIAAQAQMSHPKNRRDIQVVTPAQRQQWFTSVWRPVATAQTTTEGTWCWPIASETNFQDQQIEEFGECSIINRPNSTKELTAGVWWTGSGLTGLESAPNPDAWAPSETWVASAETIAVLARSHAVRGVTSDVWSLAPLYLRPSAAEEKAAARRQGLIDR